MAAAIVPPAFSALGAAWTLASAVVPLLVKATGSSSALDRRKLSVAILLIGAEILGFMIITALLFCIFWALVARKPKPLSPEEKARRVRIAKYAPGFLTLVTTADSIGQIQESDLESQRAKAVEVSSLSTAFGALVGTGVLLVSGFVDSVKSAGSNGVALALPILVLGGLSFAAYGLRETFDTTVPIVVQAWQCTIRPLAVDFLALPLTNIVVVMIPTLSLGIAVLLYRVYNLLMWGPARVLLTFVVTNFITLAKLFGQFVASLILGLVFWINSNPLYTQYPLDEPLTYVFEFAYELYAGSILPSCQYLKYVVGGIGESLRQQSLRNTVASILYLPWTAVQQLFFMPVLKQTGPSIEKFNDLTTVALQNAGFWIQNVTVIQFDIYLGNIKGYVNGSLPIPQPPESYIQYLVNFFKSRYAETVGFFFASASSLFWEALRLIFYAPSWFTLGGNTFLTFNMLRVNLINFFDSAEGLLDIAPTCVVEGNEFYGEDQNIKFGPIIGGLGRALVAAVYIVLDLAFGEMYTLLELTKWPGYFSALYFVRDGDRLQEFSAQIPRFAKSFGCTFGLLDPGIGRFLQSALNVFLNLGIRVPIYLLAYTRWAYEQNNPSILDLLDNTPNAPLNALETEALQISNIATFIYRFDNADAVTCRSRLSFVCGLGATFEALVQLFIRGFLLLLRSIKNVVKAFVSVTSQGQLGPVTPLDISGFNQTAYRFGCRLGTTIAYLIPIDLQCHATRPGFCAVREFRSLPTRQTPNVCMATFACRLGNYLAVGPELIAIFLQYGSNFEFVNGKGPLISVISNIYAIFIDKILSPLCPFAHAVDCWLSAITSSDVTATSQFLCLINSFLIRLGSILRDTVTAIIELFFYVIQGIFGGFTTGTFTTIIQKFFQIVGVTFEQIFFSIVGLFLGWITSIIEAVCGLLCICSSCEPCKGCRRIVDFLKGQTGNLANADEGTNYKKRGTSDFYAYVNMTEPMQKAFGFMFELNVTYSNGTSEIIRVYRNPTAEDLPTHYATYVGWTPGTPCHEFFRFINGTKYSELRAADVYVYTECLQSVAVSVSLASSSPFLSWLPKDIKYNPIRIFDVFAHVARFTVIGAQFVFDKIMTRDRVMSTEWKMRWKAMGLNVSHYENEMRQLYPGPGLSELTYVLFEHYRQSLTIDWYLKRNVPEFFDPDYGKSRFGDTTGGIQTYADVLYRSYLSTTNFIYTVADIQYNNTLYLSTDPALLRIAQGMDPVTNMSLDDGSYYSSTSIYVWNNESNVRAEVYKQYGDQYVSSYDESRVNANLYVVLGQMLTGVTKFIQDIISTWTITEDGLDFHDVLDSSNYMDRDPWEIENKKRKKRSVEETESTPGQKRVLVDASVERGPRLTFSQVIDSIWESAASRVDEFMIANGAANEQWAQHYYNTKKRSMDADEYPATTTPPVHLEKQPRLHRLVVASVSAFASLSRLNTSYIPYWCSLSNATANIANCSVKYDWTLSTKFLDPSYNITEDFQFLANETASVLTELSQPRTPEARGARQLTYSLASAFVTYSTEFTTRIQHHLDNENIPRLLQSVKRNWDQLNSDVKQSFANTETTETVIYDPKAAQQSQNRFKTFYEEQEAYREWKRKFQSTPTYKDYSEGNATISLQDHAMSYANYVVEETTANAASSVPLSTYNTTDPRQTGSLFRQSNTVTAAVTRAATQFFLEESRMMADREVYMSLFQTKTPLAAETALQNENIWMDQRTITLNSITFRRKLYEQATGKKATMRDDRVPIVQIKTHREALLIDRRPDIEQKIMMSAQGVRNLTAIERAELTGELSRLSDGRQYALIASASAIRTEPGFIAQMRAMPKHLKPVRAHNVVEIRVLQNKVGNSYLGSKQNRMATAESVSIGSQFFFPESRNESIDFARSVLGCQLGDATLCEQCIVVDYVVGKIVSQVLWTIGYYTVWFPAAFLSCVDFLLYTFNLATTVRIGYGNYPVRFPARGLSTAEWFRFTPREAVGFPFDWGPKLDWFFQETVGVPLPTELVQNGTLMTQFNTYLQERAAGLVDVNVLWETFNFIENVLQIPVLQFVDTIIDFITTNYREIASSIYDKYSCNYATDLDCSKRTFSWAGGWIQILTVVFTIFLFVFVFVNPIAAGVFLSTIAPFLIPLHMVVTYGWSFGCGFFIPQCYTKDAFDFIAYTVFNKCSPLLGMFVSNTDYNLNTCTQCSSGFGSVLYNGTAVNYEGPHCPAQGFNNLYDGLDVFSWYWEAYGLSSDVFSALKVAADVTYNILNIVSFGIITKPVPSADWRKDKFPMWTKSDPMFANFLPCSLTALVQGYAGLGAQGLAAVALYFPILQFGVSALASLALTVLTFIGFINLIATNTAASLGYVSKNVIDFQLSPSMIKYTIYAKAAELAEQDRIREERDANEGDDGDGDDNDDSEDDDDDDEESEDSEENADKNDDSVDDTKTPRPKAAVVVPRQAPRRQEQQQSPASNSELIRAYARKRAGALTKNM